MSAHDIKNWNTGYVSRRRLLAGIAAGATLNLLGVPRSRAAQGEPVKIGFVFPFSGKHAVYGRSAGPGVDLAVKMVNENGGIRALGGAPLNVLQADDKGDVKAANSEIERLISREKIAGLIGVFSSTQAVALNLLADQYKVPFVSFSWTTEKGFSTGSRFSRTFYIIGKSFAHGGFALLQFLNDKHKLNAKKIGLIYDNSEYGRSVADAFREKVKGTNLTIVVDLPVTPPVTDFGAHVLRLRDSGADVIMATLYTQDVVLFLRATDALNYRKPVIGGGSGFADINLPERLGKEVAARALAIPVFGPVAFPEMISYDPLQKFLKRARSEGVGFGTGGLDVNWFALGAQAVFCFRRALETAGNRDGTAINAALVSMKMKHGSDDLIAPFYDPALEWDQTGRPLNQIVPYVQWQDGKQVLVYPPNVTSAKPILG